MLIFKIEREITMHMLPVIKSMATSKNSITFLTTDKSKTLIIFIVYKLHKIQRQNKIQTQIMLDLLCFIESSMRCRNIDHKTIYGTHTHTHDRNDTPSRCDKEEKKEEA